MRNGSLKKKRFSLKKKRFQASESSINISERTQINFVQQGWFFLSLFSCNDQLSQNCHSFGIWCIMLGWTDLIWARENAGAHDEQHVDSNNVYRTYEIEFWSKKVLFQTLCRNNQYLILLSRKCEAFSRKGKLNNKILQIIGKQHKIFKDSHRLRIHCWLVMLFSGFFLNFTAKLSNYLL